MNQPHETPARTTPNPADVRAVKQIVRTAATAAIAMTEGGLRRGVARTGMATDIDGMPIFALPRTSPGAALLNRSGHVSLLVGQASEGDPAAQPQLTLHGDAGRCTDHDNNRCRGRFIARHPENERQLDSGDLCLWRLDVGRARLARGAGPAIELGPDDFRTTLDDLAEWGAREARARDHMNEDHADAVALYATGLAEADDGDWSLSGIDPEGIDLMLAGDQCRVWFETPLKAPSEMHHALIDLVRKARAKTFPPRTSP